MIRNETKKFHRKLIHVGGSCPQRPASGINQLPYMNGRWDQNDDVSFSNLAFQLLVYIKPCHAWPKSQAFPVSFSSVSFLLLLHQLECLTIQGNAMTVALILLACTAFVLFIHAASFLFHLLSPHLSLHSLSFLGFVGW
ncbi:hypothetical protein K1719_007653 [Acacia pycnantha]|nr:hypothetical protein K1719_007653 [Acacia pycnantha]